MKLLSCNECGIIVDADKLYFPHDLYTNDGGLIDDCEWDGDDYIATVPCPVCTSKIRENS